MIFNSTIKGAGGGGGGGSSERYIKPVIPQLLMSNNANIQDSTAAYAALRAVGDPGTTMRIVTNNHYYLSSITRDDTSASVPFTEESSGSRGGTYSFTMPDADVTFDLYYDD